MSTNIYVFNVFISKISPCINYIIILVKNNLIKNILITILSIINYLC